MWCKNMGTSFFHFVIIHAFAKQTRQKCLSDTMNCITCSCIVKTGCQIYRKINIEVSNTIRFDTEIETQYINIFDKLSIEL